MHSRPQLVSKSLSDSFLSHSQTHSEATLRLIPKPLLGSFPSHSWARPQDTLRLIPKPLSDSFPSHSRAHSQATLGLVPKTLSDSFPSHLPLSGSFPSHSQILACRREKIWEWSRNDRPLVVKRWFVCTSVTSWQVEGERRPDTKQLSVSQKVIFHRTGQLFCRLQADWSITITCIALDLF